MDGQLGFYAAQPLVDLRLEVNGMADSNQGLGDLILGGMLGWHQGNHHWIAALETVLGTGEYDTQVRHIQLKLISGKTITPFDRLLPIVMPTQQV